MRTAVVGGGSWGTALASHLARSGLPVSLWIREPEVAQEVNERQRNETYLPGIDLPAGIAATSDLGAAVRQAEAVLVVVPSEFCRSVYRAMAPSLSSDALVVSATKGLEIESLLRMTEVAAAELPGSRLAVLSGPSFAREVAQGQPTAVVIASERLADAERVQRALSSRSFRAYTSEDVVGVELAGALKNVIAIAAGILDGLGYGHNTVAALITRGLAEISRLGLALGGRSETLAGLAGLGDLVLTCTGALSRNRSLGQALGRGESLAVVLGRGKAVAEGVRTTAAACVLAERGVVEMPIAFQMREVLYRGKPPREALDELMLRSLKKE
jgi:glycerol-3-phosphate dehydrogenase (NAD(P)+)